MDHKTVINKTKNMRMDMNSEKTPNSSGMYSFAKYMLPNICINCDMPVEANIFKIF